MRYEGSVYRPPSEHDALIVQATIGCSWNHCTYCAMYRDKTYRVRDPEEMVADLDGAVGRVPPTLRKLFVADGDALGMPMPAWRQLLDRARHHWPGLGRVSCYATARNVAARTDEELAELVSRGLTRLYLGPESGDDTVMRRIAKGAGAAAHIEAAQRARAAGLELSVIVLLGAGGTEHSQAHAEATADLITGMDPDFLAALALTVVPDTPLARQVAAGRFSLPSPLRMLEELRVIVDRSRPTDALFRSNHASNHLPLRGRLPRDREALLRVVDGALQGRVPLRPEWARGL